MPSGQFLGELQLTQISLNFKTSCWNLKFKSLEVNLCVACILFFYVLNKNINFNEMKQNWNWEMPHTVLERRTLCFSSYKNHKFKRKLWWAGALERKTRAFLFLLFYAKEFFLTFVLYLIYSMWNTLSEYTFTLSKNISYTFVACFWNCRKPSVYP